jgi:pimeloyl-ACP methyl ester carboxylesterase
MMPTLRGFLRAAPKALLGLLLVAGTGAAALLGPYALRTDRVAARPGAGFHSDYYLYVPASLRRDARGMATLLVQPNNSGRTSDDIASHRRDAWMTGFERKRIADELGVALLVPAFPRTARDWRVYTHALDRDVLTTRDPLLTRLDLQLLAMVEDARRRLAANGTQVDPRVLVQGFSASGMFANRFAVLHPDRVRAAAIGSPGGWPIAPVAKAGADVLPYPAGVADLQALTGAPFDAAAYARVPQLFYMGDADDNDSLDFEDGWDKPAAAAVDRMFGDTPLARWKHAEALYARAGADARFELVPGVGHDRKALQARSTAFFREVLAGAR